MINYLNYDLQITKKVNYCTVYANCPPYGDASDQCEPPFTDNEIDIIAWKNTAMQIDPQEIGKRLYKSIFDGTMGSVGKHFAECLKAIEQDKNKDGLRIRLDLTKSPQLARLPWEYLYDNDNRQFLALSKKTTVVRYLELNEKDMPIRAPLHILVIIANSKGDLQADEEWERLRENFKDLVAQNEVKIERLPRATRDELHSYLMDNEVHALHFVGHGSFDSDQEAGRLYLEDSSILDEDFSVLLHDRSIRLVYLNSCDTGRTGIGNPLNNVAQWLVQKGVPAVVAMQAPIYDSTAIQLASTFYRSLMKGNPVDRALTEGRIAVFNSDRLAEWGTPVLFMNTPDGTLIEDPRYSKWFINREQQLRKFRHMIQGDGKEQIMIIEAGLHMGKTSLILEMEHEAVNSNIPFTRWIFEDQALSDYRSLLNEVSFQMDIELSGYFDEMDNCLQESTHNEQAQERKIAKSFIKCLQQCSKEQRVLILVDSIDKASPDTVEWIKRYLIEHIRRGRLPNVRIVITGKSVPIEGDKITLDPFGFDHVQQLIRRYRNLTGWEPEGLDPGTLSMSSLGQPFLTRTLLNNVFGIPNDLQWMKPA